MIILPKAQLSCRTGPDGSANQPNTEQSAARKRCVRGEEGWLRSSFLFVVPFRSCSPPASK